MKKGYIIIGLVLTGFLFLSGCGGGSVEAPAEATITIDPESVSVSDASSTATWSTQYFLITVKDENDVPLKDVEVRMYFIWAAPAENYVVQFYDEENNPVNSPFYASTDENGTYRLRFDFVSGGGYSYSANLEVSSGSVYESAQFAVSAGGGTS